MYQRHRVPFIREKTLKVLGALPDARLQLATAALPDEMVAGLRADSPCISRCVVGEAHLVGTFACIGERRLLCD